MAHFFDYNCQHCGFTMKTSGPHECLIIEKEKKKHIKRLPHPGTDVANGIVINGYCSHCKKNVEVIIAEFNTPGDPWEQAIENIKMEYQKNYSGFIKDHLDQDTVYTECYNYDALVCPTCTHKVIFFPLEDMKCPHCGKETMDCHQFMS